MSHSVKDLKKMEDAMEEAKAPSRRFVADDELQPPPTTADDMMDTIAATGGTSFQHIFLYNSIRNTGEAEEGIDGFIEIHANLMGLHGFMAGFQYVVISEGTAVDGGRGRTIIALQTLGFLLSLSGTLMSLIAMEYLRSTKQEPLMMQVSGILRYGPYFRLSDIAAIIATFIMVISINLIIYDRLPVWLCYVFNVSSAVISIWGMTFFKRCIIDRQADGGGRLLYKHRINKGG